MKGCIVLQGDYAKLGHSIAVSLKNHRFTDFCGYIFTPHTKKFIESQNDIKYTQLLIDHELHEGYEKIKIDYEYIREFEKKLGDTNLWSFFYGDRQLLLSTPPKDETTMEIKALYGYEDLLRVFLSRVKPIEEMLDREKPEFILFFTVGTIAHKILFHLAKKKGIKTFVIHEGRIGKRVTVSENYSTITGVEELFKNPENIQSKNIEEAKKVITNFRKTGSLQLEFYTETENKFIRKKINPLKKIYNSISWLIQLTKNYFQNRKLFLYGVTSLNPLRFVWYQSRKKIRKLIGFEKFYSQYDKDERYAFYPLHLEPEQAILDYAPYYINQTALIEQIARSLPIDMKLYIKDHPTMSFKRKKTFYKKLLNIPNVKIIDHRTKSFEIIKNSSLIITTTSTVGWEALFLKKPVITFGNVFYNIFPTVKKCTEIEKLYELVKEQIEGFEFDDELFMKLVASVLQDTVDMNLNSLWFENFEKIKNDQGIKDFAKLIAKKL
jgi:capsule polysaccharide modification protein KpsS